MESYKGIYTYIYGTTLIILLHERIQCYEISDVNTLKDINIQW